MLKWNLEHDWSSKSDLGITAKSYRLLEVLLKYDFYPVLVEAGSAPSNSGLEVDCSTNCTTADVQT